jgi:hypothetical protein
LGGSKELRSPAKEDGYHDRFNPAQISACTLIDCQNVYDYIAACYEKKPLDWKKDIFNWKLPFPGIWLEFSLPRKGRHAVMLVEGGPCGEGDSSVLAFPFFEQDRCIVGPFGVTLAKINGDGTLADYPETFHPLEDPPEETRELFQHFTETWMATAFLSVSFMHCKNVTIEPVDPPKELNRERKKAGLKPFVRYHTINIEPMKKVLRTEGNIEVNGLKKALHIVRGHFSTYSEERPLFGKVAGTFWVPAHTRGEIKQGIVVSDYNVKAPANP